MSFEERESLDKEIYNEVCILAMKILFLSAWNNLLNNLPDKLKARFPEITYKEILFVV